MSQQYPDRIETQVNVEMLVKPIGISFELRISGNATIGSAAAIRKSRELLAVRDLMTRLGVPDERIRIDSVTFASGEGWLSGSNAQIALTLREVPLEVAAEALGNLSVIKGVSLVDMHREYGDLREERDSLLRRGVIESKRQANIIAAAAELPILSVYVMTQKWMEPDNQAMSRSYEATRGARLSKSAAVNPDELKGYELFEHHESRLSLNLRMEFRVGEFQKMDR
ncbi:MAG: hypothetical protein JF600_17270 [Xanthomonadales bacterium]|nr:hypothetical protein [Xanthomonadales bacterium]